MPMHTATLSVIVTLSATAIHTLPSIHPLCHCHTASHSVTVTLPVTLQFVTLPPCATASDAMHTATLPVTGTLSATASDASHSAILCHCHLCTAPSIHPLCRSLCNLSLCHPVTLPAMPMHTATVTLPPCVTVIHPHCHCHPCTLPIFHSLPLSHCHSLPLCLDFYIKNCTFAQKKKKKHSKNTQTAHFFPHFRPKIPPRARIPRLFRLNPPPRAATAS
jgi:hypothetical protein